MRKSTHWRYCAQLAVRRSLIPHQASGIRRGRRLDCDRDGSLVPWHVGVDLCNKVTDVCKIIPSPIGKLKLVGSDKGLAAVLWKNDNPRRIRVRAEVEDHDHPVLLKTERQLGEYFEGKRESFSLKGNPQASRAVGVANGRNPIAIVVPCHRVIGTSGKLTGFAGGLDAKAHLLQLENGKAHESSRKDTNGSPKRK
jgi:methylated-DNA-[protein]-cysteine S-methyltransferase